MEWILGNWVLVLLIGGMLAIHLPGHRHGKTSTRQTDVETTPDAPADARVQYEDA